VENKTEVKNSSTDINFGSYKLEARFRTDGGRLYKDKEYKASIEIDEEKNILRIIIKE
jgi:hypothetical protein